MPYGNAKSAVGQRPDGKISFLSVYSLPIERNMKNEREEIKMQRKTEKFAKYIVSLALCFATLFTVLCLTSVTANAKSGVADETQDNVLFPVAYPIEDNAITYGKSGENACRKAVPYLIGKTINEYVGMDEGDKDGKAYIDYITKVNVQTMVDSYITTPGGMWQTATNRGDGTNVKGGKNEYVEDNYGFSRMEKVSVHNAETYDAGGESYGIISPEELRKKNESDSNPFRAAVISGEYFSVEELKNSSFYFMPTNYSDNSYYIYLYYTCELSSGGEYTYRFSLNAFSTKDDDGKAVDVLYLQYEPNNGVDISMEATNRWCIKSAGNGQYYIYTKKDTVYYANSETDEVDSIKNGYMYLTWDYYYIKYAMFIPDQIHVPYLTAKSASTKDPDEMFESIGTVNLYANLTRLQHDPQYDAFKLVDGSTEKYVVTKGNQSITFPESESGTVLHWQQNALTRYTRGFKDYTEDFADDIAYASWLRSNSPNTVPTSYTTSETVTPSQYSGNTFYANRQFKLSYEADGLIQKYSLQVRTGTLAKNVIFAAETDVASGTLVTENNWVSMALASANKSGVNYSITDVRFYDSSGKEITVSYTKGTLSNKAPYILFNMPEKDIKVKLTLSKEFIGVSQGADGFFVLPSDTNQTGITCHTTLTADMLTPVELMASTKYYDADGYPYFTIISYDDEDWQNEFYENDKAYFEYSIAECTWYMKIGENGTFTKVTGTETKNAHFSRTQTYLPGVTEDTTVYYKCEYKTTRVISGETGALKTFTITANVKKTANVPKNSFYVCYKSGDNYYRSGQTHKVGDKIKLYTTLYNKYPDVDSSRAVIGEELLKNYRFEFEWFIKSADGTSKKLVLNNTAIKKEPTDAAGLVAEFECTLIDVLKQKTTEAEIYCRIKKTDKSTGESVTYESANTVKFTLIYDSPVGLVDYDAALTAHLDADHIYAPDRNITKWEYSTDNGETWTEIPLNNPHSGYSKDYYIDAPFSIILTFGSSSITREGYDSPNYDFYTFTVKTPGIYLFRMTNAAGSVNTAEYDFTKIHAHVWSDYTYHSSRGHYQKCTVDGCGAYKRTNDGAFPAGESHTLDEDGLCYFCQGGKPFDVELTFNLNGGDWAEGYEAPESCKYGETPVLPTNENVTYAKGYSLSEWKLTSDKLKKKEYTAQWAISKYKLIFVLGNGEDNIETEIEYGSEINATLPVPKRFGFTLEGWEGTIPTTMPDGDVVITAKWKPVDYNISYVLDGGENAENAPAVYTYGVGLDTLPMPTKDGCTFMGWTLDGAAATIISGTQSGDITLTANWKLSQAAPEVVPEIESKTEGTVTLKELPENEDGAKPEYSIDGGKTWQDSPVFENVEDDIEYTPAVRYGETDSHAASDAVTGKTFTGGESDEGGTRMFYWLLWLLKLLSRIMNKIAEILHLA